MEDAPPTRLSGFVFAELALSRIATGNLAALDTHEPTLPDRLLLHASEV